MTMTLDEYLSANAVALAKAAEETAPPLHRDSDPVHPGISTLLRQPKGRQGSAITATVKAMQRQRTLLLVGACGAGKTFWASSAAHLHAAGKAYRALVMCPGHLVRKWKREIEQTLPGAQVTIINDWRDAARLRSLPDKPMGPEWFVIGRDKAKLGTGWKVALMRNHLSKVCPHCGAPPMDENGRDLSMQKILDTHAKCGTCKEPLVQPTCKPRRWPPARIIKRLLGKGWLDYFIADEVHELAGDSSAQGHSLGALASIAKRTLALTGTLSNGKAQSLKPILFRLCARDIVSRGYDWHSDMPFSRAYGRIEITEKVKTYAQHNRNSFGTSKSKSVRCVPGIMPSLFGHMLIGNVLFLALEDVAEGSLPQLHEQLIGVDMSPGQRADYDSMQRTFRDVMAPMLRKGDRRLLATMLQTLMCWPDCPFGWGPVGYKDRTLLLDGTREVREVNVVKPPNYVAADLLPKEEKLLELVLAERAEGRQVWVFAQYTGDHDVTGRIEKVLKDAGLRVGVLRQSVKSEEREAWIAQHGPGLDVCICHPRLVQTGVDLFDHGKTYNFPTIIFYETGYNVNELRQASRRAWRVGQDKVCKIMYLYYTGTMEERALSLMGRKVVASESMEGKFSTEGLSSLGADDSLELELARSLAENLAEQDAGSAWSRKPAASMANEEAQEAQLWADIGELLRSLAA